MSFQEATAYLDALGVDAMKSLAPSLHRIEAMCEALNHPERALPAVHITGTNGKTSVASIATSLLGAAGLSVGTFTSPHLQTVRERIALAGEPISPQEFGDAFSHLLPYLELVEKQLEERLTYFEVLTAMFFLWAAEAPVDALVIEVGLGGRWDATNVVPAKVAVVANVGLDHRALLGETRRAIAQEKSGIIKAGCVAVTAERTPDVLEVIVDAASAARAPVSTLGRDFDVVGDDIALGGRYLSVETSKARYDELYLPLHGRHQTINAATALEAVTHFIPGRTLEHDVVSEGLAAVSVRGRIETVQAATPTSPAVVLDVAHNAEGMGALVATLHEAFPIESVTFVVGVLQDKDHQAMLAEMARIPCRVVTTSPTSARAIAPDELARAACALKLDAEVVDGVAPAVQRAIASTDPGDLVCVTGSHYVVGEARSYLLGEDE